jgi:hypothetical protein
MTRHLIVKYRIRLLVRSTFCQLINIERFLEPSHPKRVNKISLLKWIVPNKKYPVKVKHKDGTVGRKIFFLTFFASHIG